MSRKYLINASVHIELPFSDAEYTQTQKISSEEMADKAVELMKNVLKREFCGNRDGSIVQVDLKGEFEE